MEQKHIITRFVAHEPKDLQSLPDVPKDLILKLRRFKYIDQDIFPTLSALLEILNGSKDAYTLDQCNFPGHRDAIVFLACYNDPTQKVTLSIGQNYIISNQSHERIGNKAYFDEFFRIYSEDVYLELLQYCWNFHISDAFVTSVLTSIKLSESVNPTVLDIQFNSEIRTEEVKTERGKLHKMTPGNTKVIFTNNSPNGAYREAAQVSAEHMQHLGKFLAKYFPHAFVSATDSCPCFFNYIWPDGYFPDRVNVSLQGYWRTSNVSNANIYLNMLKALRWKYGAILGIGFAYQIHAENNTIWSLIMLNLDILLMPEHKEVFQLFQKFARFSEDQLNYFRSLRKIRLIDDFERQLIILEMRYCSQKVERTRTVKALDRTIKYTCEEKCNRMRSYLLSDYCQIHGRPAGRSMTQVFRDDLAFFRTLQRQPVPPIPPRIPTRTEQITENTIGTFLPYLNNYLFDCYQAARNKFFIVTQEQSLLYSCVVCGIGSSDRSPWSDFLVRGLYDPRLLMIIMSLALV